MRQAPAKLSELIEPVVAGLGYELYGIEYLGQGKYSVLRVYIDQAEGITVDDCARVSHQLSAVLDVEDPIASNYELEVSSPGMDRPLLSAAHFQRYVGETVKIKTMRPIDGRSRFSGVLREAQDESAILDIEGESVVIPFEAVNQARLVPEF